MQLLPRRPDEVPDREIVHRLKSKDPEGLQQLLRKHGGRTRFQLRQEFGGLMDANAIDSLINHAAWQAWIRAETFDEERGELGAWFFVIARNLARASRRREQRRPRHVDGVDLAEVDADQGTAIGAGQASRDLASQSAHCDEARDPGRFTEGLQHCIAELPRLQQLVIKADLRSGDVADAAELAAEFRTSTNSIYVTRSNARKALKRGLEAMGLGLDTDSGEETG